MGCFRRKRPPTRAIPDIRLLDGLKELKNRIWRAISRALGAKNIRSMARTVNSWFSNRVHGGRRVKRQPDAETAAPIPERAPYVSPEPVADAPADLGPDLPPYVNFDKLTDAVLAGTGMFARFDEHEEPNSNCKSKVEDINGVIIVTLDKRQSSWAAATCDFKQCGIFKSVDSDEHVQPPFKRRNSKCCSVSGLHVTVI